MPRKRREKSSTCVYHWIVRGMNKRSLFHGEDDYECFYDLLYEYKIEYAIQIYHYCMMTNHIHLLLRTSELKRLSGFSHYVQRRYAYYYSRAYKRTGSTFQRGYRSFPINKDSYLLECGRYIERNPIRAKVVERPEDYPYTSYRFYAMGEKDKLLTFSPAFLALSDQREQRKQIYADYVCQNRVQEEMMERGLLRV